MKLIKNRKCPLIRCTRYQFDRLTTRIIMWIRVNKILFDLPDYLTLNWYMDIVDQQQKKTN